MGADAYAYVYVCVCVCGFVCPSELQMFYFRDDCCAFTASCLCLQDIDGGGGLSSERSARRIILSVVLPNGEAVIENAASIESLLHSLEELVRLGWTPSRPDFAVRQSVSFLPVSTCG